VEFIEFILLIEDRDNRVVARVVAPREEYELLLLGSCCCVEVGDNNE